MSKSFQIKQAQREEIAHKLTVRAVADAALRLKQRLQALNDEYWERHLRDMEKLLGIPQQKFRPLIAQGVLTATTSIAPEIKAPPRDEHDQTERWAYALHAHTTPTVRAVLQDPAIGLCGSHELLSNPRFGTSREVDLYFRCSRAVPCRKNMAHITKRSTLRELKACGDEYHRIADAAADFHKRTMSVLMACKSSRQMADLFPEAAKLLPRVEPQNRQMVPKEQIDQVRQLLETGVPA